MSITYKFVPLDTRTYASKARKRSQFDSPYSQTLQLLERELKHLQATHVVIQADVEPSQVRNDGLLRSGTTPRSPAIVLSFSSKYGDLSYPCDTFTAWQDNLRAIALSLECLRKVDRYGVTRKAEQYQGWAKLPPPKQSESSGLMTVAKARELFGLTGNVSPVQLREIYRSLAKIHHPDVGGSEALFKQISEAYEVLQKIVG